MVVIVAVMLVVVVVAIIWVMEAWAYMAVIIHPFPLFSVTDGNL